MRIAAVALVLILGGCGDTASDVSNDPATPAASTSADSGLQSKNVPRPALQSDGFSLRMPGAATAQAVVFAMPRAAVESAAQRAFPTVSPTRQSNAECPPGAMDFTAYGPLTLNFQHGRFVGWFLRAGADVATIDGIMPGITRADLETERSVQMDDGSTIDGLFTYVLPDGTEIGGVMEGEGGTARVTALFAGTNCFFS